MAIKQQSYFLCFFIVSVVVLVVVHAEEQETITIAPYKIPSLSGSAVFFEPFDASWDKRWVVSQNEKFTGTWKVDIPSAPPVGIQGDKGLVVGDKARHHAISTVFDKPLDNTDKDLIVQYEVRLQNGLDCGGAYLKLIQDTPNFKPNTFSNDDPYIIMFGPDKCGNENKVHFILRHENPLTHEFEEKHIAKRPSMKTDRLTHLYALHVRKDNTFEIFIDQTSVASGNLLTDMNPAVNPPKEIDDPTDLKPADWVDSATMPDPDATKPDDWDEDAPREIDDPNDVKPDTWLDDAPAQIPDPEAQRPEDWSDEFDGEWEAPTIPNPQCEEFGCGEWKPRKIRNPEYKGKWSAPLIDNPNYKGPWKARQIPNPNFYEDLHPHNFKTIAGLGIELWTMTDGIMFDNIILTHDARVADDFAAKTWVVKSEEEKAQQKAIDKAAGKDASEPGFFDQLEDFVEELIGYAAEYPMAAVATAIAVVAPLIFCCWWSLKSGADDELIERRKPADASASSSAGSGASASASNNAESSGNNNATPKEDTPKKEDNKKGTQQRKPKARKDDN